MTSKRMLGFGPREAFAGHGGLLTAAAFAVVLGLAVLLGTGAHASNVAAGIGLAAAIGFGPLIAWRLRGRRVDGSATGGALLGLLGGGAGRTGCATFDVAASSWVTGSTPPGSGCRSRHGGAISADPESRGGGSPWLIGREGTGECGCSQAPSQRQPWADGHLA